jgi:hypothetical protein
MSRHVADKRTAPSQRPLRFLEIEKRSGEEGTHPATRQVLRADRSHGGGKRLAEFLRIERGRTA